MTKTLTEEISSDFKATILLNLDEYLLKGENLINKTPSGNVHVISTAHRPETVFLYHKPFGFLSSRDLLDILKRRVLIFAMHFIDFFFGLTQF